MNNYLLLIYPEALSDDELRQVSDFNNSAKIEEIAENESNLIAYAYYRFYNSADLGACYRLYTNDFTPAGQFIRYPADYIGRFDDEYEEQSISAANLCFELREAISDVVKLSENLQLRADDIQKILGIKHSIKWNKTTIIQQEYRQALLTVEAALVEFFEGRRYIWST